MAWGQEREPRLAHVRLGDLDDAPQAFETRAGRLDLGGDVGLHRQTGEPRRDRDPPASDVDIVRDLERGWSGHDRQQERDIAHGPRHGAVDREAEPVAGLVVGDSPGVVRKPTTSQNDAGFLSDPP